MLRTAVPLLVSLLAAACGSSSGPTCDQRVASLSARLAAPRPLAEIRKTAAADLGAALDSVLAAGDRGRAAAYAGLLQGAVRGCPDAARVFGEMAALAPDAKVDHLRARAPAAFAACGCKASPEYAGGLVEALLTEWATPRPPGP